MTSTSITEVVVITGEEHKNGELSRQNLDTAKRLFSLHGAVAWQCLWPHGDIDHEALNLLPGLPVENNFIYVKTRSLLPQGIVNNKFVASFLASQFPTAKLLQIYARHATKTGIISVRSPDAIATLFVQLIVAHDDDPLSIRIDWASSYSKLKGHGLAIVRYSATDMAIHVESGNYTVITLDYALEPNVRSEV